MKIVLAQYFTNNLSYGKYSKAINEQYCSEQEYIYHLENSNDVINKGRGDRAHTWWKPKFLLEVFEKYNPDYILFLDADAVVINNKHRIESFINKDVDVVVTHDYGPSKLNAGVLLFKNTEWSKKFLQDWWDIGEEFPQYKNGLWWDQTGFGLLMDRTNDLQKHIIVIDNSILNSNSANSECFIFHAFAYGSIPNRTIDMVYYKKFKIDPPTDGKKLSEIADYFNTDKQYSHNYFVRAYDDIFFPLKDKIKTFVEIGVLEGESLKLWKKYFNCRVIGIDKILTSVDGAEIILCDQSNEIQLKELAPKIEGCDVILDDGSHKMYDQMKTMAILFKSLKPGGIYIIENLQTSLECKMPSKEMFGWGDPTKTTTLDMLKQFINKRKISGEYFTDEEIDYLNNNIETCKIFDDDSNGITSVITKVI